MSAEIENNYLLHNDNELTRLALQHVIIKDAMKGKQIFAPINFSGLPLQILDISTADGTSQPPQPPRHPSLNPPRPLDTRPSGLHSST
jgi:hypothetical protein